jgi:aspartate racemase
MDTMRGVTETPATIGLLAGMGWPSTITYYREINERVSRRLGGAHTARMLIWSNDYADAERMELAGAWDEAGRWLADGARRLEAGGADMIAIACNTMHRAADAVRAAITVPLVDIVEAVADEASARGLRRVAVLATSLTLEMDAYPEKLGSRGIQLVPPADVVQRGIDDIIYEELCHGAATERAKQFLDRTIADLVEAGVDGVVLACTELGLVVTEETERGTVVIDSLKAHAQALVDASLGIPSSARVG